MYEEKQMSGVGLGPADRRRQNSVRPQHLQDAWAGPASWRRLRASADGVDPQPSSVTTSVSPAATPTIIRKPAAPAPARTAPKLAKALPPKTGIRMDVTGSSAKVAPKTKVHAPKAARPLQTTRRVMHDIARSSSVTTSHHKGQSFLQRLHNPQPAVMAPMALLLSKYIMYKVVALENFAQSAEPDQYYEEAADRRATKAAKRSRRTHRSAYARAVHKRRMQALSFGFALVLAAVGSVVSVMALTADHSVADQQVLGVQTQTSNSTAPSDAEVTNYVVAPSAPRLLSIPSIDVRARVRESQTSVTSPTNDYDVAWDTTTTNPASGIAGSVSVVTGSGSGAFSKVASLAPGSVIAVTRGDGVVSTYKVETVQVYGTTAPTKTVATTPYQNGLSCLNLVATNLNGGSAVVFAVQQ